MKKQVLVYTDAALKENGICTIGYVSTNTIWCNVVKFKKRDINLAEIAAVQLAINEIVGKNAISFYAIYEIVIMTDSQAAIDHYVNSIHTVVKINREENAGDQIVNILAEQLHGELR